MPVPRQAPKPSFHKQLIPFVIAFIISLFTTTLTGWILTRIFPSLSSQLVQLINSLGVSHTDVVAQVVRTGIGFIIGLVISMGITAAINLAFKRRSA